MNRDELEPLIARHLDGRAAEAETAILSRELEASEDSRRFYLRLARLHAALGSDEVAAETAPALPAPASRPPAHTMTTAERSGFRFSKPFRTSLTASRV